MPQYKVKGDIYATWSMKVKADSLGEAAKIAEREVKSKELVITEVKHLHVDSVESE